MMKPTTLDDAIALARLQEGGFNTLLAKVKASSNTKTTVSSTKGLFTQHFTIHPHIQTTHKQFPNTLQTREQSPRHSNQINQFQCYVTHPKNHSSRNAS